MYHTANYPLFLNMCQPHTMRIVQEDPLNVEHAFGRWLRARRDERGLSQSELASTLAARGLAIDASAISRIESGGRSVRLSEASAIASALGEVLFAAPIADRLSEGSLAYESIVAAAASIEQLHSRADALRMDLEHVGGLLAEADEAFIKAIDGIDRLDEDTVNYLVGRIGSLATRPETRPLFDAVVQRAKPFLARSFVDQWDAQRDTNGKHQATV